MLLFLIISGAVITVAGGQDQRLVLFYAVSVFLSFLAGLVAMARFSARARRPGALAVDVVGAALLIAALLYGMWVRAGRPRGIRNVAAEAEQADQAGDPSVTAAPC